MIWPREKYFLDKASERAIREKARRDGPSINIRLRFAHSKRLVCHHDLDGYERVFGSRLIGGCDPETNPDRMGWYVHINGLVQLGEVLGLLSGWSVAGPLPSLVVECFRYKDKTIFEAPIRRSIWPWFSRELALVSIGAKRVQSIYNQKLDW